MILADLRSRLTESDHKLVVSVLAQGSQVKRDRAEKLLSEGELDALLDDPDLLDRLVNAQSMLHPSPALFYYVAVRHLLLKVGADDRELADYLAAMLLEFGRRDRAWRVSWNDDHQHRYLIDILADLETAVTRAFEKGLRMIGLTHFQASSAAYPMTVAEFDGNGLTPFGRDLIDEMERLGMVVDLAHVNYAGVDEALARMKRPFVVSHTACRALHDMRRNLEDEHIRAVAERGGVIGLCLARSFTGRPGVAGFVDHVEHAIRVGGADCVALGSDWDGAIVPVEGLGDVTGTPRITQELVARGHPPETVRKFLGQNALRVLTDVCG